MARRPDNPKNRGRRSEGPLDWLNEENQATQQPGPAPAADDTRVFGAIVAPPADLPPRVDPSALRVDPSAPRVDPSAPRVDPSAPRVDPSAPPLGRRAARAQREALQARQSQGRPPQVEQPAADRTQVVQAWPGPPSATPLPSRRPGESGAGQLPTGQIPIRQLPADQAQGGQAWLHELPVRPETRTNRPPTDDHTQAGQAWSHQFPPDQTRNPQARSGPPGHHSSPGYPFAIGQANGHTTERATGQAGGRSTGWARDRTPDPGPDPGELAEHPGDRQSGPQRRKGLIWLTLAALVPAAWSATSFINSDNVLVAGLAAIAPLVSVLALPVIAVGAARRHLVPTVIAVVAALLPWTLVAGYAVAGPGGHTVGGNKTLRVMSVDGAKGRASAKGIVQLTRLYAVDVVVVTDLTSAQAHDLTVAGLNALAPARWVNVTASGVHGTGLWARPAIATPTRISGLSSAGVDGVIEAGTAKIGISVVHLAGQPLRPGASWRSDLAVLAKRTPPAKDSFIVGDLNASPWQPAFRKLTGSKWRDAANVVGQGLRPTWPAWSPLPITPVDHVLASPGLGVAGADTANLAGTSHRALIVTLVLPQQPGD